MPWVWIAWLLAFAGSFALFEGYAIKTGRMTLSRFVWNVTKGFPPFGWVCGVIVGFLAAHFFWPGQGCLITGF